jgi:hypothetical protein
MKTKPLQTGCIICQKPTNWDKDNKRWRLYCSRVCVKLDSVNIRTKTKQTNLDRYGVEHNWSSGELRDKQQETMKTLYGVTNPQHCPNIKEKTKQTNLIKYGYENQFNNPDIQNAITQTRLLKYGVENITYKNWKPETLELLNNINWLSGQYNKLHKTATQIAVDLQIDTTTVCNYLRKHNIPIRYKNYFSGKCINWLETIMESKNINIQHALNGGEYKIPETRYTVDGYCEDINTIYEFHGDLWHGNPVIYQSTDKCHPFDANITAGELYQKTIKRENQIKELGYNLVVMWENDFNR